MSRDVYKSYLTSPKHETVTSEEKPNKSENGITVKYLEEINAKIDNIARFSSGENQSSFSNTDYCDIALINGSIVFPGDKTVKSNLLIKDGIIMAITNDCNITAKRTIDVNGKYILPGIVDPHVHLGLFASMSEDIELETVSALKGGITTAGCYFSAEKSHFDQALEVEEIVNAKSSIDIFPHMVINNNIQVNEIRDYVEYLGVTSFKLYMNGIPGLITDVDDGFIIDVFEELKKVDKKCIVCVHTENRDIVRRATKKIFEEKGNNATIVDWSDTHPDIAEEEACIRISYLAEKHKTNIYLVHISTALAINRLRKIIHYNPFVKIETTSPYLTITKHSVKNNTIKMEPPFRNLSDVEELWNAVEDSIVDSIGTDNVTMTMSEKKVNSSIWEVVPGYPALETHLAILLHEGVIKRGLPIEKIIEKITKNPAETFGIYPQKGTIAPGGDADLVVVDMNTSRKIKSSDLSTRSDFSIYEGTVVNCWPVMTIKSGKVVVEKGVVIQSETLGKYIKR